MMIILVMAGVIYSSTGILLFIAAVLIAALFIYFSVTDATNTITTTFKDVQTQITNDYANAQVQLGQDLSGPLFEAIIQSRVPCPPRMNGMIGTD